MNFSIKDFFSKCGKSAFAVGLVKFTEESINGKLHFLRSVCSLELNPLISGIH